MRKMYSVQGISNQEDRSLTPHENHENTDLGSYGPAGVPESIFDTEGNRWDDNMYRSRESAFKSASGGMNLGAPVLDARIDHEDSGFSSVPRDAFISTSRHDYGSSGIDNSSFSDVNSRHDMSSFGGGSFGMRHGPSPYGPYVNGNEGRSGQPSDALMSEGDDSTSSLPPGHPLHGVPSYLHQSPGLAGGGPPRGGDASITPPYGNGMDSAHSGRPSRAGAGAGDVFQSTRGPSYGTTSAGHSNYRNMMQSRQRTGAVGVGVGSGGGVGSGPGGVVSNNVALQHQRSALMHQVASTSRNYSPNGSPAQPTGDGGEEFIYQVHFKRSSRYFYLHPSFRQTSFTVKSGSYVKVEADRGEDLGIVGDVIPGEKFWSIRDAPGMEKMFVHTKGLNPILRLAHPEECRELVVKTVDEATVTRICREILMSTHRLPINIIDSEYQFDRKKLIIYHDSKHRVDFREFVKDLFGVFKTRIWMQQIDITQNRRATATGDGPDDLGVPTAPGDLPQQQQQPPSLADTSGHTSVPTLNGSQQSTDTTSRGDFDYSGRGSPPIVVGGSGSGSGSVHPMSELHIDLMSELRVDLTPPPLHSSGMTDEEAIQTLADFHAKQQQQLQEGQRRQMARLRSELLGKYQQPGSIGSSSADSGGTTSPATSFAGDELGLDGVELSPSGGRADAVTVEGY